MRRIWNSWTYYGDAEKPRQPKEEAGQHSWPGNGRKATDGPDTDPKGALESAYERARSKAASDALERAMDLSDVRRERVARVKQAIDSGSYRISARELAQRLIRNMRGEYN